MPTDVESLRADDQPKLHVQLIGPFRLSFNGQDVPLANRRARSILILLTLRKEPIRREALATALWDDKPEREARNSLRQVLFQLKAALAKVGAPGLSLGREVISFSTEALASDIDQVLLDLSSERANGALDRLVGTPEFFDGFDGLSRAFDAILRQTRADVSRQITARLQTLYDDPLTNRDLRQRAAETALVLDPFNESACRSVMKLAAEQGDTSKALRAYASVHQALADEFDMEPSEQTIDLVVAIKRERPTTDRAEQSSKLQTLPAEVGTHRNPIPKVAILPFRVLWGERNLAAVVDALVEETVARLTTFNEPLVISTNSTSRHADGRASIEEIRELLGADYVVTGSVRPVAEGVRYQVNLIDSRNHVVLWANSVTCDAASLHAQIDNIAVSIARTIVPTLRRAELETGKGKPPEHLSIYQQVMRARELLFLMEPDALDDAQQLLELAAASDRNYAPVHVALANLFSLRLGQGWSENSKHDSQALDRALRRAIATDELNGRALAIFAHHRIVQAHDFTGARVLTQRAVEAMPNDAETLMWCSSTPAFSEQSVEAIEMAERAMALSPEDPLMFRFEHFLGSAHYLAGRFEEAVYWGLRSAERNPRYTSNLRMTAAAAAASNQLNLGSRLAANSLEIEPDFRINDAARAFPVADEEHRAEHAKRLSLCGLPQ